jgi:hypothetical protein
MNGSAGQIIYKQLLDRHSQVRVPMIQRDYAQGRRDQKEVRDEFLGALEGALARPVGDSLLPLNLDFIYGSIEGEGDTCFSPLDGQQRLTTLFLLHWYLAWIDGRFDVFKGMFQTEGKSRFSYSVRPSSSEFFNELVAFHPEQQPGAERPSKLITDQPWYFRSWRLDPTIQGTLVVLDEINARFSQTSGLFDRITSEIDPVITFQLLDLDHFGLSDDLYIKMNARGKPLTPFETFKARYEQELAKQFSRETRLIGDQALSIADFVALRMDTTWSDLFWPYRDKKSNLYDGAIMNLFRAVALITRSPDSESYLKDVALLRSSLNLPSYPVFLGQGWLDESFTLTLISLLEVWSRTAGFSKPLLPTNRFFDERKTFERLIQNPTGLTLPEIVQLTGYVFFLREHEQSPNADAFQEWMRIVHNLVFNTSIERPEDLRSSARGLRELLSQSDHILEHFSKVDAKDRVAGFNDQQVKEESLKARLILMHGHWRALIERAEGHGYFRGQIEFLLDFSGALAASMEEQASEWPENLHVGLQGKFEFYLELAEATFDSSGLKARGFYEWQRALLSIGDYLLPSGRQNLSFLVNASTESASWKRLLRGSGYRVPEARKLLHRLWDRLNTKGSIEEQLRIIISSASIQEAWRSELVQTGAAFDYCGNRAIRWNGVDEVYLLTKTQMNGAHAELFTFCLYERTVLPMAREGQLAPLVLREYQSVNGTDVEPGIVLAFAHEGYRSSIKIVFRKGNFVIAIWSDGLVARPDLERALLNSMGFVQTDTRLIKSVNPTAVREEIVSIAKAAGS